MKIAQPYFILQNHSFSDMLLSALSWTCLVLQIEWASAVLGVSSESIAAGLAKPFSAQQVLGKPNKLPAYGESPCAWRPATADNPHGEWIQVSFDRLIQVQTIVVAESFNPGAIKTIKLYDTAGKSYVVYHQPHPAPVEAKSRLFVHHIPPTPYKVAALRLELQTSSVPGFNQIDAIGIAEDNINPPADIGLNRLTPALEGTIEPLGKTINSPYDEILPVISPDGKTLYFVRKNHPDNMRNPFLPQLSNDDIWYAERLPNGSWKEAQHMPPPLNNYSHNYVCTALPDNNTLLLANRYLPEGRCVTGVSITYRTGKDTWQFPQPLLIDDFYNQSSYSEYFMAANQQVLLMAIQRRDSYGERDLYVSFRRPDNTWTAPMNLGKQVNTAGSEITPVLAADNKTLYFASNGHSGYGEMDIFMTRRLDDTWQQWSEPVNLGPPINTPDWDASYTIDAQGEYAYFVSYYQSTHKSADLFRMALSPQARPEQVAFASGKVRDAITGQPITAQVIYTHPVTGQLLGKAYAHPVTGDYQLTLPLSQNYCLRAVAEGFFAYSEQISAVAPQEHIKRDLLLMPLQEGQTIRLNHVIFEQSSADLLPESYDELTYLVELMKTYPAMEIRLEGHTDIEGNPLLNMQLSKERVQRIREYLISQGIQEHRIFTEAFGSTQPLTRKRDPESKKLNRRVEFRILKMQ